MKQLCKETCLLSRGQEMLSITNKSLVHLVQRHTFSLDLLSQSLVAGPLYMTFYLMFKCLYVFFPPVLYVPFTHVFNPTMV